MKCIILSAAGVVVDQVELSNVAVGDRIPTKRGMGTVTVVDFGLENVYVTCSF